MRIECSCGKVLSVSDALVGRRVRCPGCGEIMLVEDDESSPPPRKKKPLARRMDGSRARRLLKKSQPSWALWLGVGGGTVAASALIITALFMFAPSRKEEEEQHVEATPTQPDRKTTQKAPNRPESNRPPEKSTLGIKAQNKVDALAYSPDGKKLASLGVEYGAANGVTNEKATLQVWDLATRKQELRLECKGPAPSELAVSPDAKMLATYVWTNTSGEVQLWDLAKQQITSRHEVGRSSLKNFSGKVLQFNLNGTLLFTGEDVLYSLEPKTGKKEAIPIGSELGAVAACSPVETKVAIAFPFQENIGDKIGFKLVILDYLTKVPSQISIPFQPFSMAYSDDGQTLALAIQGGLIVAYDTRELKLRATSQKSNEKVLYYKIVKCSPNGSFVAGLPLIDANLSRPSAEVWQVGPQQPTKLDVGWCSSLAISPSGKTIAVATYDESVKFVDPLTGREKPLDFEAPMIPIPEIATPTKPDSVPTKPIDPVTAEGPPADVKAAGFQTWRKEGQKDGPVIGAALYGRPLTEAAVQALKSIDSLEVLDLRDVGVSAGVLKSLNQLPNLRRLIINTERTTRMSSENLFEIKEITNLQVLSLYGEQLTDKHLHAFQALTNLTTLKVEGNGFSDAGIKELRELPHLINLTVSGDKSTAAAFNEFKHLESLEVHFRSSDQRWGDFQGLKGLQTLKVGAFKGSALKSLARNPDLRSLTVTNLNSDDASIGQLKGLAHLQSLNLQGEGFNGSGLAALKDLPDLHELILSGKNLSDAGLECVQEFKRLDSVQFFGRGLTDITLKHCHSLPNLRVLKFYGAKLTGAGLGELHSLEKLGLGGSVLGDPVLKQVKQLKSLRYLSLLQVGITDEGLRDLELMTNLEHLTLFESKTTEAGISRLQKALPKLTVQTFAATDEF